MPSYFVDTTLALPTNAVVPTALAAIKLVFDRLGLVLVVLGVTHLLHLYLFSRLRLRGQADLRPPFPADARIPLAPES